MPKIQKNKIEQSTKIFIYRDLKQRKKTTTTTTKNTHTYIVAYKT